VGPQREVELELPEEAVARTPEHFQPFRLP
jgi:hypothetical protein